MMSYFCTDAPLTLCVCSRLSLFGAGAETHRRAGRLCSKIENNFLTVVVPSPHPSPLPQQLYIEPCCNQPSNTVSEALLA